VTTNTAQASTIITQVNTVVEAERGIKTTINYWDGCFDASLR
jgi:hypothetical protein